MQQSPTHWDPCLEHASLTDIGLRRANNQDSMSVIVAGSRETWQRRGHLFIVADGMGAHAAGELASKMAVDVIGLNYSKLADLPPAEALVRATEDANAQINQRGEAQPEFRGMGTTCTSLVLLPEGALVAHVGDSRAYRLRGNRYEQLTFDHSLVWEMKAAGKFADGQVPDYIPKNIITRSLGPNPQTQVDLEGPFPLAVGATFLLCSDGLSGQVEDHEMAAILATMGPEEAATEEAAQALIDLAKLRGGPDNITTIIVRVGSLQDGQSGESSTEDRTFRPPAREVHPALWTSLGIVALATILSAAMQIYPLAAICLAATVIAAVAIVVLRRAAPEAEPAAEQRRGGKAPYTTCKAAVNETFIEELDRIAEELRRAAAVGDWSVDDAQFDRCLQEARDTATSGDHPASIRHHLRAIRFMMSQLREESN